MSEKVASDLDIGSNGVDNASERRVKRGKLGIVQDY
jgi:hypothetical protein